MRQHIIRILPVLFLSGILLSSCNQEEPSVWSVYSYGKEYKQVHEETNGFDITYQFAPDVIRYEKEQANTYIISVEEDATVVVSAGAPSSFLPHVGSILSAGITQTTPRGLGNKVVEIMEADGTLRCKTEPAPLDEIFTELEISGSTDLGSAMAEGYEDEDGYHEFEHYTLTEEGELVPATKVHFEEGAADLVSIPISCIPERNAACYVKSKLIAGAILSFDLSLSRLTYDISLESFIGLREGEVGVVGKLDLKKFWDKHRVCTIPLIPPFPLEIGPVVTWPYLNFTLDGSVELKGELALNFEKVYSAKVGINNEGLYYSTSTNRDGAITGFSLDGFFGVEVDANLNFGLGLYTTNVAAELIPCFNLQIGADARLSENENVWRFDPKLIAQIALEAKADLYVRIFGYDIIDPDPFKLTSIPIWGREWPILPQYQENSMSVDIAPGSPLRFNAKYALSKGGLLSRFGIIHPAIAVYRGGNLEYTLKKNVSMPVSTSYTAEFVLEGLEQDVSYTAKPCIEFMGKYFELDGYPFSSTTPTVAVTDIVQTGSAQGSFYHNGNEYEYEFYFYVNSYIIGSQNCLEWGIYDPNSDDVYNPNGLQDGKVTQYWTAWSNNPYATFTKTPYVILLNGEYKYYESHTHTLTYGGGGPVSIPQQVPAIPLQGGVTSLLTLPVCCQLDSVVFQGVH